MTIALLLVINKIVVPNSEGQTGAVKDVGALNFKLLNMKFVNNSEDESYF